MKRIELQRRRKFSDDFKRQIVNEYESGNFTINELSSLHQIDRKQLYRWIYRYSLYNKKGLKVVEYEESSEKKLKELQAYIKELERALGRSNLESEYYKRMVELAKTQLGLDLKKNFDERSSPPSKPKDESASGS